MTRSQSGSGPPTLSVYLSGPFIGIVRIPSLGPGSQGIYHQDILFVVQILVPGFMSRQR